jgi:hypothetical protein
LLFELGTGLQRDADDHFFDLNFVTDSHHAVHRYVNEIARFHGLQCAKQIRFFFNRSLVDLGDDVSEF